MRKTALLAVLIATVMVVPIAAYAIHSFTDVPDSAFFSNSVTWMKDNGITVGCNPPANTEYCPNDNVSRGEMAVFMKRLAERKVVDAATAVTADNATTADHATTADSAATADDATKLGGLSPDAYQSRGGAVELLGVTPLANTATVIASITGFSVPVSGGAIIASADTSPVAGSSDIGFLWIEIDGTGSCTPFVPLAGVIWEANLFAQSSTSLTAAANAGSHRIDLCANSTGGFTNFTLGSLTVQWVEKSQGGVTTMGFLSDAEMTDLLDQAKAALEE